MSVSAATMEQPVATVTAGAGRVGGRELEGRASTISCSDISRDSTQYRRGGYIQHHRCRQQRWSTYTWG